MSENQLIRLGEAVYTAEALRLIQEREQIEQVEWLLAAIVRIFVQDGLAGVWVAHDADPEGIVTVCAPARYRPERAIEGLADETDRLELLLDYGQEFGEAIDEVLFELIMAPADAPESDFGVYHGGPWHGRPIREEPGEFPFRYSGGASEDAPEFYYHNAFKDDEYGRAIFVPLADYVRLPDHPTPDDE